MPPFTKFVFPEIKNLPRMNLRNFLGGCAGAVRDLGLPDECCSSCHSEWDDGDGVEFEIEVENSYYVVCCAILEAWRAKSPTEDQ